MPTSASSSRIQFSIHVQKFFNNGNEKYRNLHSANSVNAGMKLAQKNREPSYLPHGK